MFGKGLGFLLPFLNNDMELSDATPDPETTAGAAGGAPTAARGDHVHPRLTSAHSGLVLGAGGNLPVTFTRTFVDKPSIVLQAVNIGSAAVVPPVLVVQSYTMANGLYTGCVVRGFMGQVVLVSLLGINVNAFAGNAAGIEFTLIALQTS